MRSWPVVLVVAIVGCSRGPAPQHVGEASTSAPASVVASSTPAPSSAPTVAPNAAVRAMPAPPVGGIYMGRKLASPMGHQGAWWLDRDGRDAVQKPNHVLDVIGIREGQTVADFGAGSGYFTVPMAKRVGAKGRVYAVDIQPEMLALLGKKVAAQKLANVTPVLAKPTEPSLPRGVVDVVLFVDVYHELERPDLTMTQLRDALSPTGRVVWVEYRAEDPKVAIKPDHKTTLVQLRKEAEAVGYTVENVDESLPEQRIVILAP